MHDVVIVGAGPAGSALATRLSAAGADVVVLDQAHFPRDKVCGDFVNARALAQLQALGCYDDIVALGCTPITRSSTWLGDRCLARTDLPHIAGMPAHGFTIPRKQLDAAILARAQRAGAGVVEGARAIELAYERDHVTVVAEHEGSAARFTGRIVVGADGAQSIIARRAGLEHKNPRYVVAAQRAYCHGLTLDETIVRFDEPSFPGFGWIFPVRPGLCNVGVGMLASSARELELPVRAQFDAMWKFVERLAAERGEHVELEHRRGWPIRVFGDAHAIVFERGILIGEAAAQVDPISGEGIPLALDMAELAADVVMDALSDPNRLRDYDELWRTRHGRDLQLCDLMVTFTRNQHLRDLWISGLRTTTWIAEHDREYASIVGGVFAGLVPARELLSPRVLAASARHFPAALASTLGAERLADPASLLRTSVELQLRGLEMLVAMFRDRDHTRAWIDEADEKQARVLRSLLERE